MEHVPHLLRHKGWSVHVVRQLDPLAVGPAMNSALGPQPFGGTIPGPNGRSCVSRVHAIPRQ
eukprot:3932121-Alexandrium_andersonii.AAC.1